MRKDLELLRAIKENLKDTTVIGIGATCRAVPEQILKLGGVDFALRSEYPYLSSLTELIEAILMRGSFSQITGISFLENGQIVSTADSPSLDLELSNQPSYEHLQPEEYHVFFTDLEGKKYEYLQILGSKGCHYACYYCPYPVGYGKNISFRSPAAIVDEIEFLHQSHRIQGFFFRDMSFTTSKKHALEVCNEIKRRGLDIGWYTEARVNEVDREVLEAMKNSGCKRISYGVETGDPTLISKCKSGADLGTVKKAFNLSREVGILRTANVILGWPEDDLTTLQKTYDFVLSLKPDGVNCNTLVPYPGTSLRQMALQESLITSENFDELTPDDCVVRTLHLSVEQVCEEKKKMVQGFYKFQIKKTLVEFATGKRRHIAGVRQLLRKGLP